MTPAQQAEFLAHGRGWEYWTLNAIRPAWTGERYQDLIHRVVYHEGVRWARAFNLHRFKHLKRDCPQYIYADSTWARHHPSVPFYVVDAWPKGYLPKQVIYPRAALAKQPQGAYHAGSFDMLVALAVHLGAREIALYGIALNMESGEPISARACLEYWCGYAAGRGVKVTVDGGSDLFRQFHLVKSRTYYGFDDVKLVEDRT